MLPANLTGILLAPGVRGSFTLLPFLSKQNPASQRSLYLNGRDFGCTVFEGKRESSNDET